MIRGNYSMKRYRKTNYVKNIPVTMKDKPNWCLWKLEERDGRTIKIPYTINGSGAKSNDPNTWASFHDALNVFANSSEYNGLGFFLEKPLVGLDIDHVSNQNPDKINTILNIVKNTYVEVSQSGNGYHAIFKGFKPENTPNKKNGFEMYDHERFFALTADIKTLPQIDSFDGEKMRSLIDLTVGFKKDNPVSINPVGAGNDLSSDEIVNRILTSSQADQFKQLYTGNIAGYESPSNADLALCNILAYWTNRDAQKMDAIFRQSKLYRSKWDSKRGATTYGEMTIQKAIDGTPNGFESNRDCKLDISFTETKPVLKLSAIMKELKAFGDNQRKQIKENTDKKDPRIQFGTIVGHLRNQLKWAVLGNTPSDWEHSALYFYNPETGLYDRNTRTIQKLIRAIEPRITIQNIKEAVAMLTVGADELIITQDPNLYCLGNGIWSAKQNKLLPYSEKYVFTSKIAVNYNPDAIEPSFDGWKFSNWIENDIAENNPQKLKLIWQSLHATVNSNYSYNSAVILIDDGKGSTGKGTFEQLLTNIAGSENTTAIKLNQFEVPAILANITGKALVIGDDNDPSKPIPLSENFKSAVTGDAIVIDQKYERPYTYQPKCFIVQSCNGVPQFKENTDALYRRIRIIKFNKHYDETAKNRRIKNEYIKDKQLLEWIVKEAVKVKIDGVMIKTSESDSIINEKQLSEDTIQQFLNEMTLPREELTEQDYRPVRDTYHSYQDWCKESGYKPLTKKEFNNQLKDKGYKTSRSKRWYGKQCYCWLKLKLVSDSGSIM